MNVDKDNPEETYSEMQLRDFKCSIDTKLPLGGGGFLENICTGMLKVDFRMLTIIYLCTAKKKERKKNTRSLYLICMTKQTHLYTIFTEMMTHYYHFHQQNSP